MSSQRTRDEALPSVRRHICLLQPSVPQACSLHLPPPQRRITPENFAKLPIWSGIPCLCAAIFCSTFSFCCILSHSEPGTCDYIVHFSVRCHQSPIYNSPSSSTVALVSFDRSQSSLHLGDIEIPLLLQRKNGSFECARFSCGNPYQSKSKTKGA